MSSSCVDRVWMPYLTTGCSCQPILLLKMAKVQNRCARCNAPSVCVAVKDGLSHILFITKYTGSKSNYAGCYFIVGYYEIGWVTQVAERYAIRAKRVCFVPIEKAYKVTPERWQRINKNGSTKCLKNLRHATQRISGYLLDEILQHLDSHDATGDYLREVARLKAEYNPFKQVPTEGSVKSRRFRYAVPFNRELVEHVPILKADGSKWQWERTTDLSVIGSNTRTVRMHIDPGSAEGLKRAERFWQHIWARQEWQMKEESSCGGCGVRGKARLVIVG